MSSSKTIFIRQILSVTLLVSVFAQQTVQAGTPSLPSGGTFVAGTGNIVSSNNAVTINQNGVRGVIDWTNFSIGPNKLVQILNGSGATMNRVTGSQMSWILGTLSATGTVYLINPQGILVGPKGTINTGGDFIASTLDLSNAACMADGSLVFSGNSASFIKNLGAISSSGGNVYLFANNIANTGSLKAPNGTVGLGAGQQILLKDSGSDERIFVQAAGGDIAQGGKIEAAQAEIRANGGNIYALAGNANGAITATGTATKDGRVWLVAEHGTATVDQTITAKNGDGLGGKVETSGASVVTGSNTKIVTGRGGNWLLDPDDLTIGSSLAGTIATSLNGGTDVVEQTTAPVSGGNSDILVNSGVSWSTAATLTLSAYRNVTVGTGVTLTNTSSGNLKLIADNTGTGTGTVNLSSGALNWSGSTGTVDLFYNPSGSASTKYTSPTNFTSGRSLNGSATNQFNAFMLVNNMTDLGNLNTNLSGSYGLSKTLDATGVANFTPIAAGVSSGFTGKFDGGGNDIDGLTINDSTHSNVGLFAKLGSGSLIRHLQLTNLSVTGSSAGASVGGLAGTNQGTVSQVFAQGTITGSSTSATGGMVGANKGSIGDSYTDAFVTGNSTVTGGLVGDNSGGTIATSYAAGPLTAGNGLTGDSNSTGTVTNSYFNTDTTGQSTSSGGGTGMTEAQMEGALPAGFTSSVWNFAGGSNLSAASRPYLLDQFAAGSTPTPLNGGVFADLFQTTPVVGASVVGLVGGVRTVSATSGANGFYQLLVPQSVANGLYLYSNSIVSGGTFMDNGFPVQLAGFTSSNNPGAILANYATFFGSNGYSVQATAADMQTAIGSLPSSKSLLTIGTGGSTVSTTHNLNFSANDAAATIQFDVPVTANTLAFTLRTDGAAQTAPLNVGSIVAASGSLENINLTNTGNVIGKVATGPQSVGLIFNVYDSSSVSIGTVEGVSGIQSGTATIQSGQAVTVDSVSASNHITLVDGTTFSNNAGSSSLPQGFQVWSQYPINDNRGGLSYDYKQYGATYGVTSPSGSYGQSGFLYVQQPHLTATLAGTISKTYDQTNNASANVTQIVYANMIDGDTATGTGTGTYNDKNVNTNKPVTINSFNTTAMNGNAVVYGYLDPVSASANNGTITPLPVNFDINGTNRQYNGTTVAAATINPDSATPVPSGDVVSVSGVTLNFATKNIGSNKGITYTGTPTLTGADAGNYSLGTINNGSASVSAAPVNLLFGANNKVYDGTATATGTPSLVGVFGSDNVTIQGTASATFAATGASFPNRGKDVGNNKTVNVTGLSLGGTDLFDYSWSGIVTGTGNITPLPLSASITVAPKVYDGTTTASVSGSGALSGVLSGDTVTVGGSATFAFSNANAGNNKPIAVSGLSLSGAEAGDYSATTVSATGSITQKAVTAALTANNKTYDGTTNATGTIGSLSGILSADLGSVSIASNGSMQFSDKNFGTGKTVTDTGAMLNSGNYSLTVSNGSANIAKATATATVTGGNKVYDQSTADPSASIALTGIFDAATLSGTPTYAFTGNANAGNNKAVGVSGLSLTGADASNYNLSITNGTANITPLALTASITAASKTYNQSAATTGSMTLNGVLSGDTVNVSGDTYNFSTQHANPTPLTVTESGATLSNSNYSISQSGIGTTTADINPIILNATIAANPKTYDRTTAAAGSFTLGSGVLNGDTVTVSGAAYNFANANAANGITVTESGATLSNSDYALGSVATTTANITPVPLTGTITASNKIYNQSAAAAGTLTLNGVLSGDPVSTTGATYSFGSANAGSHTVTESGASLTNTNGDYTLGSVGTATANINPLALTASITAASKTYNQSASTTGTMTLNGVLTGDTVNVSGDTYSFSTQHASASPLTVTESGATLSNSNYSLGQSAIGTTTANINPITLNATISTNPKTYDKTTAATGTMTLGSGVLTGDTVNVSGDTFNFASANAANGITVTESGATLSNSDYALGSVATATANINPVTLTGTISANNKVYNTTAATSGTLTLNGILSGDPVSATGDTYAFNTIHAGNGLTVTESGATLQNANGDYTLGSVATATANITPASLTAALNANSRAYDSTTAATGTIGALSGVLGSDTISVNTPGTFTFADKNVANGKTVTASGTTLQGNAGDYSLTVNNGVANITPAPLTATLIANNKVYDTTAVATGSVGSLTGIFQNDNVSLGNQGTFSFSDKNAAGGKIVTATGTTLQGTDASNYSLTVNNATASIAAAQATITVTGANKVYDGTSTGDLGASYSALTGILGNDQATLSGTPIFKFNFPSVAAQTVGVIGLSLTGSDSANYFLHVNRGPASITPAPLTVALNANNKVYDATAAATGSLGALSGIIGADQVSINNSGTFTFADRNVGNGKTVSASGTTLQGNQASDYQLVVTNGSANITPAPLSATFTATNKMYDGTSAATGTVSALAGVLLSDNVTIANGSFSFSDKNVGSGKTVTGAGITLGGTDAGNYSFSLNNSSANITPATLTGTAAANNKVYNATTGATGSVTLSGVLSNDNVSVTGDTYTFANKNVGNGKTVTESGGTLSGTDAGNYTLGSIANTTANITPAQLTATLSANGKVYDGTTAATGAVGTLSGLFTNDNVSVANPGSLTFSDKNVGSSKTVSISGITLQGSDAGNYTLNVTNGSANISPATLTGTTTASNKVYDATTGAAGSLALNGIVSGDTVSASGTSYSFATKDVGTGKTVTESGATLSGPDAGNYTLGSVASGTANITPATLTASVNGADKVYDATVADNATLTLNGVLGNDQIAASATYSFSNKNVGPSKAVTATNPTLSGTDAANYTIASVANGAANITPATLIASVNGATKTYDGATGDNATLALNGVLGNDQVSGGATYSFSDKNAGVAKTVTASNAILTGADAANYTVGSVSTGTADINPATLTASVTASNKTYDSTTADNGAIVLGGVIGNDQVSGTGTYAFNDKNVGVGKVVTASNAMLTGTDAANYAIGSVANGAANITPATLTASITANNKIYDATTSATGTVNGLNGVIGSDAVTLGNTGTLQFANKNVGNGKAVTNTGATLTGGDAANYTLTVNPGQANITPAPLTASITAANKTYDATLAANGTIALQGVLAQDSVTTAGTTYAFNTPNAGTNIPVTATGTTLTGPDAGNYALATMAATAAAINPATLTYTFTGPSVPAGSTIPALTGTVTGLVGGQTLAMATTGTPTFTTTATSSSAPGHYGVVGSGLQAINGNYIFVQASTNSQGFQVTAPVSGGTGSTGTGSTGTGSTGTGSTGTGSTGTGSTGTGSTGTGSTGTGSTGTGSTGTGSTGTGSTGTGSTGTGSTGTGSTGTGSTGTGSTGTGSTGTGSTGTGSTGTGSTGTGSTGTGSTGTGSTGTGSTGTGSTGTGSTGTGSTGTGSTGTGSTGTGSTGTGSTGTGSTGTGSTGTGSTGTGLTGTGSTGTGSTGTGSTGTGSTGTGSTGTGSTGTGSTGTASTGTGSTGTSSGTGSTGSGSTSSGSTSSGSTGTGSTGTGSTGTGSTGTGSTGTGSTGTGSTGTASTGTGSTGTASTGTGSTGTGSTGTARGGAVATSPGAGLEITTGAPIASNATGGALSSQTAATGAPPLSLVVSVVRYTDGSAPNFGLSFAGKPVAGVDLGSIASQLAFALVKVPGSTAGSFLYQIVTKGTVANYALSLTTGMVTTIDNTPRSLPTQSSGPSPVSASSNTNVAAAASVSVNTASVIVPDAAVASGNAVSNNTVGNFGLNYSTTWTKALGESSSGTGTMAQSSAMSASTPTTTLGGTPAVIQSGPSGSGAPAVIQSSPAADPPAASQAVPAASQTAPATDTDGIGKAAAPGSGTLDKSIDKDGAASKKQVKQTGGSK